MIVKNECLNHSLNNNVKHFWVFQGMSRSHHHHHHLQNHHHLQILVSVEIWICETSVSVFPTECSHILALSGCLFVSERLWLTCDVGTDSNCMLKTQHTKTSASHVFYLLYSSAKLNLLLNFNMCTF